MFIVSKRSNLASQVLTEVHSPIVKEIEMDRVSTVLSLAKQWVTFPDDKSVVRIMGN